MKPPVRRAQSASACRRTAVSTTPVGDWCPARRAYRLPAGFALTGVVVLAALPAALRERGDQVGPS